MFTGIITHVGKLEKKQSAILTFSSPPSFLRKLARGTSVAVNGTCLTVATLPTNRTFSVEVMPETVKRTTFGKLKVSDVVNLELPTTPVSLLSGHIVAGHVDGVGIVKLLERDGESRVFTITIPKNLGKYIASKGSITVNGISLTVVDVGKTFFTTSITPFTWRHTNLHTLSQEDLVNIEVDIIAKFVEKLMEKSV